MVWGAFSYYDYSELIIFPQKTGKPGTTKSINSKTYIHYLSTTLPGIMDSHPENNQPMFLQDNAAIHKSGQTMKYLRKKNWKLINHPPYSPDLNPIEKVWCTMKQTIRADSNNFKTISALSRDVKAE